MELIIGGVALLLVLAVGGIYQSDRAGWHNTLRRMSRISRATLEARNFRKLEKVYTGDKEGWVAAFEGRQAELLSVPEEKHKIVRHDYYESSYGPWPRWTCKCGSTDNYLPTLHLWFGERKAIRKGRQHVRIHLKRDRRMSQTGEDFLF